MRFACQSCGKAYNLPEERIAEKSNVKLKCRVCGAIVEVKRQGELVAQLLDDIEGRHGRLSEAPAALITMGEDEPDEATQAIALSEDGLPMLPPTPGTGFSSLPLPPPPLMRSEPSSSSDTGAVPPSLPAPPLSATGSSGFSGLGSPPPLAGGSFGASSLPLADPSPPPPLPSGLDASNAMLNGSHAPLASADAFRLGEADGVGGGTGSFGVAPTTGAFAIAGATGSFAAAPTTGSFAAGAALFDAGDGGLPLPGVASENTGSFSLSIVLAAFATGVLVGIIVTLIFL